MKNPVHCSFDNFFHDLPHYPHYCSFITSSRLSERRKMALDLVRLKWIFELHSMLSQDSLDARCQAHHHSSHQNNEENNQ